MEFKIRPLAPGDLYDLNEIRTMSGVMETIPTLFSESIEFTEGVMKSFGPNDHMLAAEIMTEVGAKVIGIGGLHVARKARARHSASISLIVHTDYQAKGIGRKILEKLLELADKWLLLKRVELEVSTDNIFAIHLYESFGFVTEGHKKYTYTKDGEFGDTLVMARYRNI